MDDYEARCEQAQTVLNERIKKRREEKWSTLDEAIKALSPHIDIKKATLRLYIPKTFENGGEWVRQCAGEKGYQVNGRRTLLERMDIYLIVLGMKAQERQAFYQAMSFLHQDIKQRAEVQTYNSAVRLPGERK